MAGEEHSAEKTLLEWAQQRYPETPRKRLKNWITDGRLHLDGKVITQASLRIKDPGERLTLGQPDKSIASWTNRKKIHPKLSVLYLDDALAIVDKGYGLLSIPVEGQTSESALSILGDYLNNPKADALRKRLFGNASIIHPLPVHRLDQYTSGLLCLALNADARSILIDQLRRHELLREYHAYCDGLSASESGSWNHFLKLDKTGYRQMLHHKPVEGGTKAVTHFTVEKTFPRHRVSKLLIRLETGLKHQIRIQAAAEGLPLIGDRIYHKATKQAVERKGASLPYGFRRQALHACTIGLKHPRTGQDLRFESRIPADLQRLEDRLE